jgi:N-acetylmuramoyl-L-alanine amidase
MRFRIGFPLFFLVSMMCLDAAADPQHGLRLESQAVTTASAGAKVHVIAETPESAEPAKAVPMDVSAENDSDDGNAVVMPCPLRTIVIDPGHGGTNEGAIGVAGIHEKYLTLQIALLLADRLRKSMPDVQIVLTRQKDQGISLAERIEMANNLKADLFLSLHFNSSTNPEAIGFESFWVGDYWASDMEKSGIEITDEIRSERERAATLGERMANQFNRAMRHRFDVLDRGVKPGDYTVLTRAEVPAVVLEMGFLSHAQEGLELVTPATRARIVDALVDAVRGYAGN